MAEAGFFIKLMEIPDLADKLADPVFNNRLRTDPASVFEELHIPVPEGLIPQTVDLPTPERIAEIKNAITVLTEGGDWGEESWFPFIIAPPRPVGPWWFIGPMFPWFPWFRGGGQSQ